PPSFPTRRSPDLGAAAPMPARELPAGIDLLRLQSAAPASFPLLLESVAGGNALSRWDLLLASDGSGLCLEAVDGPVRRLQGGEAGGDFLPAPEADCLSTHAPAT